MRTVNVLKLAAVAAVVTTLMGGLASAQDGYFAPPAPHSAPAVSQRAHIYLLKGLANVFSSGMDILEAKLRRQGISALVRSHAIAETLADEVAQKYRAGARGPVIIVGHSLGANSTVDMARRLDFHKVPVALIVSLGPLSSPRVPPNVARVVNYYQSSSSWRGQMVRGDGFRGSIQNIDLDNQSDINHFNIDKIDRLHAATITRIRAVLGGARKPATAVAAPGELAPAAASPATARQPVAPGAAAGASATRSN